MLRLLASLPQALPTDHDSLLSFIDSWRLMGTGIRYVDCQLLATCSNDKYQLWTRDKRLMSQAERIGCAYLSAA